MSIFHKLTNNKYQGEEKEEREIPVISKEEEEIIIKGSNNLQDIKLGKRNRYPSFHFFNNI